MSLCPIQGAHVGDRDPAREAGHGEVVAEAPRAQAAPAPGGGAEAEKDQGLQLRTVRLAKAAGDRATAACALRGLDGGPRRAARERHAVIARRGWAMRAASSRLPYASVGLKATVPFPGTSQCH